MKNEKIKIGENLYTVKKSNTLIDQDGFKIRLPFFSESVTIDIPKKGNNCINWNDNYNYRSHIEITINEETISLADMNTLVHGLDKTENFNTKGLKLQLSSEYFQLIKFYKKVIELIEEIMKDKVGNYSSRDFKLTLEL